jgi:hypothetical protein
VCVTPSNRQMIFPSRGFHYYQKINGNQWEMQMEFQAMFV